MRAAGSSRSAAGRSTSGPAVGAPGRAPEVVGAGVISTSTLPGGCDTEARRRHAASSPPPAPALAVVVSLGAAPAQPAQDAVADAADALRGDPVHVDPDAERALTDAQAEELRDEIRSSDVAVFVAVLPSGSGDPGTCCAGWPRRPDCRARTPPWSTTPSGPRAPSCPVPTSWRPGPSRTRRRAAPLRSCSASSSWSTRRRRDRREPRAAGPVPPELPMTRVCRRSSPRSARRGRGGPVGVVAPPASPRGRGAASQDRRRRARRPR